MSTNYKTFDTFIIESPIVQVGTYTDKDGKVLEVTPDVVRQIYDFISVKKAPAKIIDVHDGVDIGEVRKYVMNDDCTKIYQKGIVLDHVRFSKRQNSGFHYVSPEIYIEWSDMGHVVKADVEKLALTQNPGMIPDMYKSERFAFSAPSDEPQVDVGAVWKEPLGELGKQINDLSAKLDKIGDKVMSDAPTEETTQPTTENMIQMSQEQLTALIQKAVSEQMKTIQPEAPVVEPPKVEQPKVEDDDTTKNLPPELLDKYNKMVATLESKYDETMNKFHQNTYNGLSSELKGMGVENPDALVSDSTLTLEQKISILENYKKNFIKNSSLSSPLREPLSGDSKGDAGKPKKITYMDVAKRLGAEKSPELIEMLKNLKIFDEKGTFIG